MATYEELYSLSDNPRLLQVTTHAIVEAANAVLSKADTNPAERKWASIALYRPEVEAQKALRLILANYSDQSPGTITAATDGQIQTGVDNVVDELILAASGQ